MTATSMCSSNMPSRARRTSSSGSLHATAARTPPNCVAADAVVPQRLVVGQEQSANRRYHQAGPGTIQASHAELGQAWMYCDGAPELLFTENETNNQRLWEQPNASPWVKDAFHTYVINGDRDAVNPGRTGTKAAAHYVLEVPAGESREVRLRLSASAAAGDPFGAFEADFANARAVKQMSSTLASLPKPSTKISGGPPAGARRECSGASSSTSSISSAG